MTRAGRTHKLNRWEWPVQDIYRRTLRIALDDLSRISAFPARNPCQFGLHVASAGPFGFEFRATLNKPSKISAQTWMTQFFGLLCLSRGPFGQFAGR